MINSFDSCHPITNFSFFISVIIFSMLFQHPAFLLISLFSALCYNCMLKQKKALKSFFCFYLPMLAVVTIINLLFSHYGVTVLFRMPNGNNMTLESLVFGLVRGIIIVNVILWFSSYNEIMTSDKFMYVFGKKIPAIALIVSMSLRFVPLFIERFKIISASMKSIGKGIDKGKFSERIKNSAKILSILVTWSLENAIETSDSMRSRGYGLRGRKSFSDYNFTNYDYLFLSFIAIADVLMIISLISGASEAIYNPVIKFSPMTPFSVIAIGVYFLLCFLPSIFELSEVVKWNRLKSKI